VVFRDFFAKLPHWAVDRKAKLANARCSAVARPHCCFCDQTLIFIRQEWRFPMKRACPIILHFRDESTRGRGTGGVRADDRPSAPRLAVRWLSLPASALLTVTLGSGCDTELDCAETATCIPIGADARADGDAGQGEAGGNAGASGSAGSGGSAGADAAVRYHGLRLPVARPRSVALSDVTQDLPTPGS
jgi:hypothetical protein